MDALKDAGTLELMNQLPDLRTVCPSEYQLGFSRTGNLDLRIFIDIAIGMTGDGDGLGPILHIGHDPLDQDGRPEHGSVQDGADSAIGALPHLL